MTSADRSQPFDQHLTLLAPLRISASMAVTWTHICGEHVVGYGLFLFFVMLIALGARSRQRDSLVPFLRRRGRALLVPWLRWSLIYAVVFFVVDTIQPNHAPLLEWRRARLAIGVSDHLWFLTFAFGAVVVARLMQRALPRSANAPTVLGLAILGVLSTGGVVLAEDHVPRFPYFLWISSLPAILFGLSLGIGSLIRDRATRRRALVGVVLIAGVSYLLCPWREAGEQVLHRYAVSVSVASLGFAFCPPMPNFVERLARLTFGVYLVHPLLVLFLKRNPTTAEWPLSLQFGVVYVASLLIVFALSRLPLGWVELRTQRSDGAAPDLPLEQERTPSSVR